MSPTVELSQPTFSRLQKYAVPLVDDIQSVINKLADFYDDHAGAPAPSAQAAPQLFNPASPPDLTHTKILSVTFAQTELDPAQHNWNRLLDQAIVVASGVLKDPKKVISLLKIHAVAGKKEDQGYRFLAHCGLSVQGQDANASWRAIYRIAKALNIPFDVEFMWAQKDGLAYAGQSGRFLAN
jgi:hypothetical protein